MFEKFVDNYPRNQTETFTKVPLVFLLSLVVSVAVFELFMGFVVDVWPGFMMDFSEVLNKSSAISIAYTATGFRLLEERSAVQISILKRMVPYVYVGGGPIYVMPLWFGTFIDVSNTLSRSATFTIPFVKFGEKLSRCLRATIFFEIDGPQGFKSFFDRGQQHCHMAIEALVTAYIRAHAAGLTFEDLNTEQALAIPDELKVSICEVVEMKFVPSKIILTSHELADSSQVKAMLNVAAEKFRTEAFMSVTQAWEAARKVLPTMEEDAFMRHMQIVGGRLTPDHKLLEFAGNNPPLVTVS